MPDQLTTEARIRLAEMMGWDVIPETAKPCQIPPGSCTRGRGFLWAHEAGSVIRWQPDANTADGREQSTRLLEQWCAAGDGRWYDHERREQGHFVHLMRTAGEEQFGEARTFPLAACRALLAAIGAVDGEGPPLKRPTAAS